MKSNLCFIEREDAVMKRVFTLAAPRVRVGVPCLCVVFIFVSLGCKKPSLGAEGSDVDSLHDPHRLP